MIFQSKEELSHVPHFLKHTGDRIATFMYYVCITDFIIDHVILSPDGRFPPSFIHQVIIITGLNKL